MSSSDRLPGCASRGMLIIMKTRLQAASKAHNLLKRKVDALQVRFRTVGANLVSCEEEIEDLLKDGRLALAKAKFTSSNFHHSIIADVMDDAHVNVVTRMENITGINIPIFEFVLKKSTGYELAGLAMGGKQIAEVKRIYREALKKLVNLASLKVSFHKLDLVIRNTCKRVNALEGILIPKITKTITYVLTELDEQEREEIFRIKKVKEKKLSKKVLAASNRKLFEPTLSFSLLEDKDDDIMF